MNNVSTNSGAIELNLLVAALVLGYGLWTGQDRLGFQGMWRVLGTLIAVQAVGLALFSLWARQGSSGLWGVLLISLVGTALAFLPFLVAVFQAEQIRNAARDRLPRGAEDGPAPSP